MEAITAWPSPLITKMDVRSFLGTCGQEESMDLIKEALRNAEPLKPIDYKSNGEVILAVDTSYLAVRYYLYQCDIKDKKKRNYCLFGSITLNEREARFSQPKRELYRLKLALLAMYYWTVGCRKLAVETDAKYIKGMLDNPSIAPNAMINRWIEEIWKYHFTLIHIPATSHSLADSLSQRPPGGQEPAIPKLDGESMKFEWVKG
ncbi:polyprotein [Moniliophthora roreri MCA 2997]|uniref:Polyprotein n=1 Tax=Moniliophthora roreri (strain MCA 2997) TaxID=1381753 RepID=V2WKW7_MONRO|nr:polyprotein [Moniliophthora roreri MCA 2997]